MNTEEGKKSTPIVQECHLPELSPDDFPEGKEEDYQEMPFETCNTPTSDLNPDDFPEEKQQDR